jgi:hypothetical protein
MSGDWAWKQVVRVFLLDVTSLYWIFFPGYPRYWPWRARCNICTHNTQKRQNNGICWHRKQWVLSIVPVYWQCTQQCPLSTLRCALSCWLSCHSKE